jgi:hypothetical protein
MSLLSCKFYVWKTIVMRRSQKLIFKIILQVKLNLKFFFSVEPC